MKSFPPLWTTLCFARLRTLLTPARIHFVDYSSYPQGIVSFFPTLLSLVAVIANFWMFWAPDFICLQWEISSGGTLGFDCHPLRITSTTFWDQRDDDMQHAPLQAALQIDSDLFGDLN